MMWDFDKAAQISYYRSASHRPLERQRGRRRDPCPRATFQRPRPIRSRYPSARLLAFQSGPFPSSAWRNRPTDPVRLERERTGEIFFTDGDPGRSCAPLEKTAVRVPRTGPLYLAIDQGTSSSRAFLFDSDFGVIASAREPLSSHKPHPAWSEQDANEILRGQLCALGRVIRRTPRNRSIAALGISNQRSTLVLWRRRDGAPVCPALSWQDRRASSLCERLSAQAEPIRRRTGLRLSPHYTAPKLLWLLKKNPSLRRGLRDGDLLCGTVNSFLIWHLTGKASHLTDHSNAARMLLLNLSTLKWDSHLLSIFDLSADCLPEIRPTFSYFGTARIGERRIPICCSLGDQQAALLGQGCHRPGEAAINYGTGGFFLLHTGETRRYRPGLLTSIASSDSAGASYLLEGTVNSVGSLLEWTRRVLPLPARPSREKRGRAAAGCPSDLFLIPGLSGLGAPHWSDQMSTLILNFGSEAPWNLRKAAMESIAFLVRDIFEAIGPANRRMKPILVGGGISRIDDLVQLQSDLLQLPLRRPPVTESSARGAALGAAHGAGLLSLGSISPLEGGTLFRPRIAPADADRLYGGWEQALTIARALAPRSTIRSGYPRL